MTKKRFIFAHDDVALNLKTPIMDNNKRMSIGEVLDEMNTLYEKNEQLKKLNNEKDWDVIDMEEPRKQSVSYRGVPCTARTCVTNLNRLTEENQTLKEENEQLKRQVISLIENGLKELFDDKYRVIEDIKKGDVND